MASFLSPQATLGIMAVQGLRPMSDGEERAEGEERSTTARSKSLTAHLSQHG